MVALRKQGLNEKTPYILFNCLHFPVRSRNLSNPVRQILGTGYAVKAKYQGKRHQVIPCGAYLQDIAEAAGLGDTKVVELGPPEAPPWTVRDPSVDICISEIITKSDLPYLVKSAAQSHIDKNYAEHLKIYTDGSKDPEGGRISAALYIPSKIFKLLKDSATTSPFFRQNFWPLSTP